MLSQVNGPYGKIYFTNPSISQWDYANHLMTGISSTSLLKQPENWSIFYKHLIQLIHIIPDFVKAVKDLSLQQ